MTDLLQSFSNAFQAVRGEIRHAAAWSDAAHAIAAICAEVHCETCAIAQLPEALAAPLAQTLDANGVTLIAPPYQRDRLPAQIDTAQVGVTGIDFAIAETGTLVEIALNDATRLVSSLPRVHIGVVSTQALVPTLAESAAPLRDAFTRHNKNCVVSFLSGPSRTGDIELRLTLGVHGPEAAYALLVDEPLTGSDHAD